MRTVILSFTRQGAKINRKMAAIIKSSGQEAISYGFFKYEEEEVRPFQKTSEVLKEEFNRADCLLFIGACQIAVRTIAPFIKAKQTDPAVLVMDERGSYVVPILSGHLGGGNEMAVRLATACQAVPVITTATDVNGLFAVDVWAKENNLVIGDMTLAKQVSAALLEGEKVGFCCEDRVRYACPEGLIKEVTSLGVCVTYDERTQPFKRTLQLFPKDIVLGIGCRKGKSYEELNEFVSAVLQEQGISIHSIGQVASIDLKKEEEGLVRFCKEWNVPFITYSAEELRAVNGEFSASGFVAGITGVDNICERSAVLTSGNGELLVKKQARNGMTIAVSRRTK